MSKSKGYIRENSLVDYEYNMDFRVKVHPDFFNDIEFIHLHSAIYEESDKRSSLGGTLTTINGYTEWVSKTTPMLSIGWDWELQYINAHYQYVKTGPVFNNIIFHSNDSTVPILNEREWEQRLLEKKIAQINWVEKVVDNIS